MRPYFRHQPMTHPYYLQVSKKNRGKEITFRPMTLMDISQVMGIEKRSYTAPWGEYLYRSELANSRTAHYTVAILEKKIVGYAGMRLNRGQGHLTTMVVDSDYRGLGIGDAILAHKLSMVKGKGAHSVVLEVRVSNTEAQSLYKKYGFIQTGLRERFYPDNLENAFVMTLTL